MIKKTTLPPPSLKLATLHVPKTSIKEKSWLGWNIVFADNITPGEIAAKKPFVELSLNNYLQDSVDVAANRLVTPFNCKMKATSSPLIYTFEITVFALNAQHETVLFKYPSGPVIKRDGFVINNFIPSVSHVSTVPIKPPAN